MFAPLVGTLRDLMPALTRTLNVPPGDAAALVLDALHVLNACDTAAVREGLLDDALLVRLASVRDQLATVCRPGVWAEPIRALAELAPPPDRKALADRLCALRAERQAQGEPRALVDAAVDAIGDTDLVALVPALATCQLWYCETATSGLSPAAQLGVLASAVGAARAIGVDVSRPWHAQLHPLVDRLHGTSATVRYRLRLVEAALAAVPLRTLLTGTRRLGPLGALSARLAHPSDVDAVVIDYVDTEESAALVTLLALYETRSQAAFHTMLKALCDLYQLRKDDFDRVANEANYLATMNSARSDKQRMVELVKPGRIVEIGPGGGVVLDLLEQRFPDSEIIGVDLSREVVAALEHRRARWRVVQGAAERLRELVPMPVDNRRVLLDPARGLLVHRAEVPARVGRARGARGVLGARTRRPDRDPRRRDAAAWHPPDPHARRRRARDVRALRRAVRGPQDRVHRARSGSDRAVGRRRDGVPLHVHLGRGELPL